MRPEQRDGGMATLTIDGRTVASPDGQTVIQAAEKLGIFIPRYCYHPGLSIAGNCRICLVEVEKNPKLQIACNTPVAEGMVVHTKSGKAEDGRRAVLEFLLANHPLDCPVCDQSGECDLQNFYMNFGLYDPRFREQKVKKKKAVALGPHVMLDQERCILCSRCVRFTDEISKTGEFGIFNQGRPGRGRALSRSAAGQSVLRQRHRHLPCRSAHRAGFSLQGEGLVPLERTDGMRRLRAGMQHRHPLRPRQTAPERRRVECLRLKPRYNADVNQWWMCDEGRFGFGWMDRGRLTKVRHNGADSTWEEALTAIAAVLVNSRTGGTGTQARRHRLAKAHQRGALPDPRDLPRRTGCSGDGFRPDLIPATAMTS